MLTAGVNKSAAQPQEPASPGFGPETEAGRAWMAAQDLLRSMLNSEIYNLWFAPLRPVSMTGEAFLIEVGNEFCEFWLKDNYLGLLEEVMASVTGRQLKVSFQVGTASAGAGDRGGKAKPVAAQETPVV